MPQNRPQGIAISAPMPVLKEAARRIGELVPAKKREETGRGKKVSELRGDIPKQRLSEFRKMGEMLAATERQKPGEHWEKKRSPDVTVIPSLSDLGLTKRESAEAQILASIPAAGQVD